MNIQEILENYNSLKARITIIQSEIQELENEVLDVKSTKTDGMPKSKGLTDSNVENYIIERETKIERKKREVEQTKTKLRIVEDLVNTLKKYNQEVIKMRFYEMTSIEEIATKKNRGYAAIQKTIDRSIRFMEKEYNKNKMS